MYRQAYAAIISFFCILIPTENLQAYYAPNISANYCVSGTVWTDKDQDYQQQTGENGVANVLIHLYDHTNNLVDKTLTEESGVFKFEQLRVGAYTVEIFNPYRYQFLDSTDAQISVESEICDVAEGIRAAMIEDLNVDPNYNEAVAVTEIELESVANPPDSLFAMKLAWKTEKEISTSGFNILRSHNGMVADAIQVNDVLIDAKGDGSNYIFYDTSVILTGDIYYSYWLSEVENNGDLFEYGPVHRFLNAAEDYGIHSNFLPIILK